MRRRIHEITPVTRLLRKGSFALLATGALILSGQALLGQSVRALQSISGSQDSYSMADWDGDGVDDATDIDSDNDGVLDIYERDCLSTIPLNSMTYSGTVVSSTSSDQITISSPGTWRSSYSNQSIGLPIHLEFTFNGGNNGMFGLISEVGTQNVSTWNDDAFKYYMVNSALYGRVQYTWDPYNIPLAVGDVLSWDVDVNGYVTGRQNGNIIIEFQGDATPHYLAVSTGSTQTYTSVLLTGSLQNGCADRDTDNDGAPDHLDLDSDGDGCSDALESGATSSLTPDFQFISTAGTSTDANSDGLADILDPETDGQPNYTSTYEQLALDDAEAQCTETDGDGVGEQDDLDDDNDGLYDTEEMVCIDGPSISDLTFNGNAIDELAGNALVTRTRNNWRSSYSDQTLSLPVHLQYTYASTAGTAMFGIIAEGQNQTNNDWNDEAYKFYHAGTAVYGRANGSWSPYGLALAAGDILSWDVDESGYVIARLNGNIVLQFQGIVADYHIVVTTLQAQTYTDIELVPGGQQCTDMDTDGDGIVNRLDIDSDGDGCMDVSEAGFTDADSDGMLDGTGVDSSGLVTGNVDGYTGTHPDVLSGSSTSCTLVGTEHNVNIGSDLDDANVGDGVCADANGNCSLRAAIQEANASSEKDIILFDIDGDITLDSPLPVATGKIVIDGTSAPAYQLGAPSIRLIGSGFNLLHLSEASESAIKGLDLSGTDPSSHDRFGIVLALCSDVAITGNTIRNRVRAIHANGCCDVRVLGNDLRDSGEGSSHGAVYMINVCSGQTGAADIQIANNTFGAIDAGTTCAIQIANANGVFTSGGQASGAQIILDQALDMEYPIRYINVNGGGVSDVDLSASGSFGIGLRLLNCQSIAVENVEIQNRQVAVEVINGTGHSITDCDLNGSGGDEYSPAIRLNGISANGQSDLHVEGNSFSSDAEAILQLNGCQGVTISSDAGASPNIHLDQQFTGHTAIRLDDSDDIVVTGQSFKRGDRLLGTEGIIVEGYSDNVIIEECYFEGFASGLNLAEATEAEVYCNTYVQNANGIWMFYNSTIADMKDNSFRCNGVGINNHTSNQIASYQDYWGDATGSSSYNGTGDYFSGDVDASAWSSIPPACMVAVPLELCQAELCDNGIDDDGDGVVDCDDGSCLTSPACSGFSVQHGFSKSLEATEMIVKVYPNPTVGAVNILLDTECSHLRITDMLGRAVFEQSALTAGLLTIDLSGQDSGIYLIQAQGANGQQTIKMVKE